MLYYITTYELDSNQRVYGKHWVLLGNKTYHNGYVDYDFDHDIRPKLYRIGKLSSTLDNFNWTYL
jgi:hypothetical protein